MVLPEARSPWSLHLRCIGDDGTGKQGFWKCKKFDPTWPASSPWVTAVGATYINSSYGENGWDYSGGGFSCNFDRPSYQTRAIENYLNNTRNLPDSSLYCRNGRATPDIAAVGTNYLLRVVAVEVVDPSAERVQVPQLWRAWFP